MMYVCNYVQYEVHNYLVGVDHRSRVCAYLTALIGAIRNRLMN